MEKFNKENVKFYSPAVWKQLRKLVLTGVDLSSQNDFTRIVFTRDGNVDLRSMGIMLDMEKEFKLRQAAGEFKDDERFENKTFGQVMQHFHMGGMTESEKYAVFGSTWEDL